MVLDVVNKHFKMWLWVLIGLNIITKVHGWSHGDIADPQTCISMLTTHQIRGVNIAPQNTELPFEIVVDPWEEGHPITVTLRNKTSRAFRGFMLQARKGDSEVPVGKFILLEPRMTQLLRCNDSPDTSVSQSNDQRKFLIQVNWTSPEIDDNIFFRVTFVEYFQTFWRPVDEKILPNSTTPPPPTTTTTTQNTTTSTELSTTTSTELSTTTSTEPSTTTSNEPSTAVQSTAEASTTTEKGHIIFNQFEGAGNAAMNAVSFLAGVKMVLPNIFTITLTSSPFSHRLKRWSKISCSLLCAALELAAMGLFCVAEPIKVTLVVLVCVVIVINFVELVILCLPIGPSHELKDICDLTVQVCSVIHQIFTLAVIFVGVMETEKCGKQGRKDSWLLKVMVAYTVWILLFVVWDFVISTQRAAILGKGRIGSPKWRRQQRKEELSTAEVIATVVSVMLLVGSLCFAVAVAVGIFGC